MTGAGTAPSHVEGRVHVAEDNSRGATRGDEHSAWLQVPALAEDRGDAAGRWPLRSSLELGALPSAVSCARLHARELLWEWGLRDLTEGAELVVSELVTNGLRASGTEARLSTVRLALLSEGACVLILVWDASLQPPVRMDARGDSENGRGLLLVEAFSARWDWYYPPEAGGKVVWALIDGRAP